MSNEEMASEELRTQRDLRAYQVIGQSLLQRIRSGEFHATGKLPTERELAEVYSVGRAVIRDALVMLEVKGLVQSRQGSGIYITKTAYAEGWPERKEEFADHPLSEAPAPKWLDILHAQQCLESHIAKQAALAGADGLWLEDLIERLRLTASAPELHRLNGQWHSALAQASRNTELLWLSQQMWERRAQASVAHLANDAPPFVALRNLCAGDHKRTLEAVRKGDSDRAYYAMWHHFENLKTLYKSETTALSLPS
ncbi:FadR/GntR family transcriptional regulator [Asticcacaulis sp. W401b]|uniref:FadR/GntR family transcriptional regulator n=1 Tax=Asticcacaulis sp. W401b TaxID=3388666 RepID=UPI0039706973